MFESLSNTSIKDNVIKKIYEAFISGDFKKGDQLPSERVLSSQLGVSRNSVREALKTL